MNRLDFGYLWFRVSIVYPARVLWWFRETLPWTIAWLLPRKIAYFAFVRVYAVTGECGPDYDPVCKLWEAGKGR